MPLPLTTLLQISDSAFPTGAFAYSSGLEALARAGRFPTFAALESYLDAQLGQAAVFDLAFVAAAHGAAAGDDARSAAMSDDAPDAADVLTSLCEEWDASQWNTGMRTASLRQARALVDALYDAFAAPELSPLREDAARPDSLLHFAPALGAALAILAATRAEACTLYLHGIARDQAAAAVRLGLIGPRAAQALQARATARVAARVGDGSGFPPPGDARRTAPLVETGQGGHGFLYSRLFQN